MGIRYIRVHDAGRRTGSDTSGHSPPQPVAINCAAGRSHVGAVSKVIAELYVLLSTFCFCFCSHTGKHHASAHGGLSANGLSDICLSFFEMILSNCLKLCLTVEHSIL